MSAIPGKTLFCVANRGRIPTNLGSVSTANNVCTESRRRYTLGRVPVTELRLVFANFYTDFVATPKGQELFPGAAYTIEAAIEIPGAANEVIRIQFSGADTASVPDGTAEFVSDAVYPQQYGLEVFPAGMTFWVRERRVIALGARFARFGSVAGDVGAGEKTYQSNGLSASQVLATGNMTTPASGSVIECCFAPVLIAGRAAATFHDIAMLAVGDSILNGQNDPMAGGASDGLAGGGGWFTAGLCYNNGGVIPHCLMTLPGGSAVGSLEGTLFASAFVKRRPYLKYFSHAVENFGTNDFASEAQTPYKIFDLKKRLWSLLKGSDSNISHVTGVTILPRGTSSDSFATSTNMTPANQYATGGTFRDWLNFSIKVAAANGLIDGVFDANDLINHPTLIDRWNSNSIASGYTDDGTHPLNAGQNTLQNAWREYTKAL